jgi:hypothetical protein
MKSIKQKKQPIREQSNETKPNDTKPTNCECINPPNKQIANTIVTHKTNKFMQIQMEPNQTHKPIVFFLTKLKHQMYSKYIANQTNMMGGLQTKEKDNTHVKQNSYQSLKNTNFTFIQW